MFQKLGSAEKCLGNWDFCYYDMVLRITRGGGGGRNEKVRASLQKISIKQEKI